MSTIALVPSLPLTSVTADDLLLQLTSQLQTDFADWTDTQASNNMIMLLEVLAAIQEMDYAYINRQAREAFIQYALDYRNVYAHAKALGYTPAYQSPSIVTGVINSASLVTVDTVVPAGTQFNCNLSGVVYQTTAAVTIPSGTTVSAPVIFAQQISWQDNYIGTGVPNQQLPLSNTPVLPDSVTLTVNGVLWNAVDNFVDSIATDQVYTWTMDNLGNYLLQFANGISGQALALNSNVVINYNVGGGSANSLGTNGLTVSTSNVYDAGNGALLSLSAYNALAAVPGADPETSAQIQSRAPISARTPICLLTLNDVENAVSALPGILSCLAVNWTVLPTLPQYLIEIFVVPIGLGVPSPALIASVTNLVTVTKPLVLGQTAVVAGPTYFSVNFAIQVGVLPGYNQNAVQNAMRILIGTFFNNSNPAFLPVFGMSIFNSVLTSLLQAVPGTRNINVLSPTDTQLSLSQYPILGTVTFTAS